MAEHGDAFVIFISSTSRSVACVARKDDSSVPSTLTISSRSQTAAAGVIQAICNLYASIITTRSRRHPMCECVAMDTAMMWVRTAGLSILAILAIDEDCEGMTLTFHNICERPP